VSRAAIASRLRTAAASHEAVILAVIVAIVIALTIANPTFLSLANVFDILRLMTVSGILALGALLVIISGGVDVSFPAIADTAAFMAATILVAAHFQGSGLVLYGIAVPMGVLLGLINGFVVGWFRIPTLIVTLGTQSLFYGATLYFLGGVSIFNLPAGTIALAQSSLITVHSATGAGTSSLSPTILILVVAAALVSLLLSKTTLGRTIYAMGGNSAVVERSGISLRRVNLAIYGMVGGLAAVAGATNATLFRNANPIGLQGQELGIIAAVVLGGAAITGGRGSVTGTMLGVLLISIVQNSLVLVGIPATWQNVVVGVVLAIGITVPAARSARRARVAGGASAL
jgi:simple sugar transport system permease protein